MEQGDINAVSALLSNFSVRLNDLEEKINIVKDRVILLNQTVLKQGQRFTRDSGLFKDDLSNIHAEIDKMRSALKHLIRESGDFARKNEIKNLDKVVKKTTSEEYVTKQEVVDIIKKYFKNKKSSEIINIEE